MLGGLLLEMAPWRGVVKSASAGKEKKRIKKKKNQQTTRHTFTPELNTFFFFGKNTK